MSEFPRRDDIYFTAMKALFWLVFVGVFSFAAVMAWPLIDRVLTILAPFILGLVLAYVFHPIVSFVQHRLRLGRIAGIIVVAFCVVAIIVIFFSILLPILYVQFRELFEAISQAFGKDNRVLDNLLRKFVPDPERRAQVLDQIRIWFAQIRDRAIAVVKDPSVLKPMAAGGAQALGGTLNAVFSAFGWLAAAVATLVFSLIIAFYFLVEMSDIPAVIRRLLPARYGPRIWEVLLIANRDIGGFLRGQLMVCLGVGTLATILLFIVGLDQYAILIGFTAGAVNFIPYLGPTMGAAPAVLWAVFTPELASWGDRGIHIAMIVGGFAVIQAIEGMVFQPFIVGRSAALHPLAVMLALIVGAQFGIAGMIVAVPVAAAVKVFYIEFFWKRTRDFEEEVQEAKQGEQAPS